MIKKGREMMTQIEDSEIVPKPLLEPDGWAAFRPQVARRLRSEITQAQVAGAMGTSPSLVSLAERGQRRITSSFRERYAGALDRLLVAIRERDEVANLSAREDSVPPLEY